MLGAIAGDIIGSPYEAWPIKSKDFPLFGPYSRFTDDTVLTVAVADCLLHGRPYPEAFHEYVLDYPNAGYGSAFRDWALSLSFEPYNSWGNGSAMRVSPVGWYGESVEAVLEEARRSAEVTHNHPEGIKGAQATAFAVYLAREGAGKEEIRRQITERFGYNLNRTVNSVREHYSFDVSCQGSVPEAIISFLDSEDFEDAVRNAVSLGGDSDTLACIAGGVAEAHYGGVPKEIEEGVLRLLPATMWKVVEEFSESVSSR